MIMKTRQNLAPLLIFTLFIGLLLIASCGRENSQSGTTAQEEQDASMASSESDAEAEGIFDGLFDDAMGVNNDVGMGGIGVSFGRTDTLVPVIRCFAVTITHLNPPNFFPVKVVLDFGTTGCAGPDGHVRKGKIIIEYTNRLIIPGAIAVTVFDDFYIDGNHVQGRHKITNTSPPITTIPLSRQYKIDVDTAKLTKPNGNYIEWEGHKVITQFEGLATPDFPRDDSYRIEGTANGRVRRGNLLVAWQSTITEPLVRRATCRWIVKGRIRTVRGSNANTTWIAILDFGAGVCDDQATVTINGQTHQITLP
jgi:hypothetical protein